MATTFTIASTVAIVLVFILIIGLLALQRYQLDSSVPLVRAAVRATWPMGIEGFANMTLQDWLPSPEALTKKSSCDTNAPGTYTQGQGTSQTLLNDWFKPLEQSAAVGPTSQQCYQKDYARSLERAGSYAQRTNNYRHGDAESCSAPNHDLILDFYKPNRVDAPYQV